MSKKLYIPSAHTGEWWHVDSKGRLIGWMWPEDLKMQIDSIWGTRKGIQGFALYTGLSRGVIEEYCNGKAPIPKYIAQLATALIMLIKSPRDQVTPTARTRQFPQLKAEWLPKNVDRPKLGVARRPFG